MSEILSLFMFADEIKKVVTDVVEKFKQNNVSAQQTMVIMSDKSFTECDARELVRHD